MSITAYNKDFNQYVNMAIERHDYPLDPDMDWAKWFEKAYSRIREESKRDEAVHHILIHELYDKDAVEKFNPDRIPDRVKGLPLEKQISWWLRYHFNMRFSYAVEWLNKVEGEEVYTLDEGWHEETEKKPMSVTDPGATEEFEEIEEESDIVKFKKAFFSFLEKEYSSKTGKNLNILFDLILNGSSIRPKDLIPSMSEKAGISKSRAEVILWEELPKALERFARSAEGTEFPFAKTIIKKLETKSASKLEDMNMNDNRTGNKRTDKYAKFVRAAEEEPEELSESLSELSSAFSTLAESAEALVENLDLKPIEVEASIREKRASQAKFGAALRRLAAEEPEKVEEAVKEIYSSLDEVAVAIENLADHLGFSLEDETVEVEEFSPEEEEVEEF